MSRAGKVLLRCGHDATAVELLRNGQRLIREAHEAKEADLAHEILEVGGPGFSGPGSLGGRCLWKIVGWGFLEDVVD